MTDQWWGLKAQNPLCLQVPRPRIVGVTLLRYVGDNFPELQAQFLDQILVSSVAVAIAAVLGVAMGVTSHRWTPARGPLMGFASLAITIPSFALFSAVAAFTGIGEPPVIAGLAVYALLPIARNTLAGLEGVSESVIDAAAGMGMTSRQRLRSIELPLAAPLIVAGIRQATVMTVAIATVGAAVGANDLGQQIFAGIRDSSTVEILAGIIPVTVLGLLADRVLALGEALLSHHNRVGAPQAAFA